MALGTDAMSAVRTSHLLKRIQQVADLGARQYFDHSLDQQIKAMKLCLIKKTVRVELSKNNGFQLWQEQKCVLNVHSVFTSF